MAVKVNSDPLRTLGEVTLIQAISLYHINFNALGGAAAMLCFLDSPVGILSFRIPAGISVIFRQVFTSYARKKSRYFLSLYFSPSGED